MVLGPERAISISLGLISGKGFLAKKGYGFPLGSPYVSIAVRSVWSFSVGFDPAKSKTARTKPRDHDDDDAFTK